MNKIGANHTKKAIQSQITPNRPPVVNSNTNTTAVTTSLPPGWKREEILKPNGLYAGKTDIYYTSPTGQKVRSKAELHKILGQNYDVSNFDWRSGKFTATRKRVCVGEESREGKVVRLMEEYRQSVQRSAPSLLGKDKQPIVETTTVQQNGTAVEDLQLAQGEGDGALDCPRQLFWHRRLSDVCSSVNTDSVSSHRSIELPKELQNAGVPGTDNLQLLQSIVSCIFNSSRRNSAVLGQSQLKSNIEKNPCLSLTTNQPLVRQVIITDDIISRQEAKVKDLRRKLELVRRSLLPKLKVSDAA